MVARLSQDNATWINWALYTFQNCNSALWCVWSLSQCGWCFERQDPQTQDRPLPSKNHVKLKWRRKPQACPFMSQDDPWYLLAQHCGLRILENWGSRMLLADNMTQESFLEGAGLERALKSKRAFSRLSWPSAAHRMVWAKTIVMTGERVDRVGGMHGLWMWQSWEEFFIPSLWR